MPTDKDIAMHTKIEDELRRKLSCAEAELMRQTGCTADDVVSIYNLPIPKPVVNVRMGESLRLRFTVENEAAALRAQVAALVAALKAGYELSTWMACINWRGGENQQEWLNELREKIETFQPMAEAAIAAAERSAG